jgi:hypothetical protein
VRLNAWNDPANCPTRTRARRATLGGDSPAMRAAAAAAAAAAVAEAAAGAAAAADQLQAFPIESSDVRYAPYCAHCAPLPSSRSPCFRCGNVPYGRATSYQHAAWGLGRVAVGHIAI